MTSTPSEKTRTSAVVLRPALSEEAALLTKLAVSSKRYWGYSEAFIESCRSELTVSVDSVNDGLVVVAVVDDVPIGFYSLAPDGDGCGELDMFFVDPQRIRSGVGHTLMVHARAEARRHGWSVLSIVSDPYAARFYEREGALLVGTSESPSTHRRLPLYELPT